MSSKFSFSSMPGSKNGKQYANSGHRRSSIVIHGSHKKTKKDTDDTESISSTASTVIPPPPPKAKCPVRPYMEVMFEPEKSDGNEKQSLCPLKRVKLSHTLPLMLFIMINMCLVILTLLVTGLVRVFWGVSDWVRKQSNGTIFVSQQPDTNAFSLFALALAEAVE